MKLSRLKSSIAWIGLMGVSVGWFVTSGGFSFAQSKRDDAWRSEAESRFKDIYERGAFRAEKFQAEWLADSSGYVVQELDSETKQPIRVRYLNSTGARVVLSKDEWTSPRNGLVSPDGKRILETTDNQLIARDLVSNEKTTLARSDANREIEFSNPIWSPDGSHVVFVESDSTKVRQRAVLVPEDPSYPGVQYHRFARVGEELERHRIGVVASDGTNLTWAKIESPKEGYYLGPIAWESSSKTWIVERFSRFRDRREVFRCGVDGDATRIYEETNEAWVESSQGKIAGLKWIRNGQAFVVISEKDGWRHAFLHSSDGTQIATLTPGQYDIIDRAVIDEDGGWYYFYASPENATEKYLFRVPLDGAGKLERITPEGQSGTHTYEFSPDCKWAFHTFSSIDSPPRVELVEIAGHRVVRVLESNERVRAKAKEVITTPTEFLKLDVGGGITFDAWMVKPKDFDSSKKYPVFVYVYGEPHAQTVLNEWGAAQIDFHRVIADLGYIVVSIDNRGTPAPKGAAWRRAVFGSLGPLSTEEQEAGLKALARERKFVDLSRVGIWGWSGGGSNTLNAMFRKPDTYHLGIAVVPKPQPHLYNAWFQEIFMRTREVNPEGYKRAAAINYAEGLKGKLLIVTGSGETNTHIQIIEGLVDRLVELGKPFDYMVYPNRDHGLREGSGTLVHVRMLIARYLKENLPSGPQ